MSPYLIALVDSVLDLPTGSIVGGVALALLLALPIGAAYAASRRGARDVGIRLIVLTMAVNLAGMTIALAFERHLMGYDGRPSAARGRGGRRPPDLRDLGPDGRLPDELARLVLAEADGNGDGWMTAGEASAAAERLLRHYADAGKDGLDRRSLSDAARNYLRKAISSREMPASDLYEAASRQSMIPPGTGTDARSDSRITP